MSLARYRCVMSNVLQDSRLVDLQKEGGASLCLLRQEESSFNQTDDYRYTHTPTYSMQTITSDASNALLSNALL